MVTINIVTANTPPYTVDDSGAVHIVLKDIANTYADGSNPQKDFIVIPKAQTMEALNQALLLAKEDAIDYFTQEAEKIAYRALVIYGMSLVTIPETIYSGDPGTYVKTEKIGVYAGDEIIISDTIRVKQSEPDIYEVSAMIIGPDENRHQGKYVTVYWNINSGLETCKAQLIEAFNKITTPPETAVKNQIINGIGTVIPE